MSSSALIAFIEKRNELRAKQRGHSIAEVEAAHEIQYHIRKQAEIEDKLMEWDLEIAKLRAQEKLKHNDQSWSFKKMMGGLL